jgi:hypothetical protein
MGSDSDSACSKNTAAVSKALPGPPFLRHYPAHHLVAWQPQGTLDDSMLDQIAGWLVAIEKASEPFKRFVDFSQLTAVSVRTRHVFGFAKKRAGEFAGVAPVRTALFCDEWVGFGIACLYESLMKGTLIRANAFRDRASAAEWLEVPVEILMLKDEPVPRRRASARKHS